MHTAGSADLDMSLGVSHQTDCHGQASDTQEVTYTV